MGILNLVPSGIQVALTAIHGEKLSIRMLLRNCLICDVESLTNAEMGKRVHLQMRQFHL